MPRTNWLWAWIAILIAVLAITQAAAAAEKPGQADFLQGLEALQAKHWKDAQASLAKAAAADDENADYHLGTAIAAMMAGDNNTAKQEFDRAYALNPRDNPTSLWTAGFYRYIGQVLVAAKIHRTSDYANTVQEAAEKVGQLRYDHPPAEEIQRRHDKLESFAIQFAKIREAKSPDLARAMFTEVQQAFASGHYAEAEQKLPQVIHAFPNDPAPRLMVAKLDMALNRWLDARRALTADLTAKTDDAACYAARAVVNAKLGALAAAKADMALAEHYGSSAARTQRSAYDQAVAAYRTDPAKESPPQLWSALHTSVQSNQPFDQQVSAATELLRASYAHRLYWDEWYQDHLRKLEDDWRSHPKTPAKFDAVASFLLDECEDPGEQLCPKGPYRAFRSAHPKEEADRALSLFRQSLALDPKDYTAMCGVAEISIRQGQYGDGETLVRQALHLDPRNPWALRLLADLLDYAGDVRSGRASDLRTIRTWMSGMGPGYSVWTTRYPSQAEQNAADELDRVAQELWNEARQQLVDAAHAKAGSAEGYYYAALIAARDGNGDAAVTAYQQAVKLDPLNKRYRAALASTLYKLGRVDEAAAEQETVVLQRQTTANVRFAQAWNNLDRTAYTSCAKSLDEALAIDPTDERIAAFHGALAHAQKQLPDSIVWYSMALAIDEAKLRLDGASALPSTTGSPTGPTLPASAAAMPLVIDLRIAARQRELHQSDAAEATLRRAVGRLGRIPKKQWEQDWAEAVLPNPLDTKSFQQPSIDHLAGSAHLLLGSTLLAMGRYDDSLAEFTAGARDPRKDGPMDTFLAQKPVIDPRYAAEADRTRMYWAKNDPNAAHRPQWLINAASFRWLSGDELRAIGAIQSQKQQTGSDEQVRQAREQAINSLPEDRRDQARRNQDQQDAAQRRRGGGQTAKVDPPGWPAAPANHAAGHDQAGQ